MQKPANQANVKARRPRPTEQIGETVPKRRVLVRPEESDGVKRVEEVLLQSFQFIRRRGGR